MKLDLPDGGWVEVRDADSVTSGERKRLLHALQEDEDPMAQIDTLAAHIIVGWSYELPVPTPADPSPLDDVPSKSVDEVLLYAQGFMRALTPNFEPDPDPGSPTSPSTA